MALAPVDVEYRFMEMPEVEASYFMSSSAFWHFGPQQILAPINTNTSTTNRNTLTLPFPSPGWRGALQSKASAYCQAHTMCVTVTKVVFIASMRLPHEATI